MIDIHIHILHGLDDGPADLAGSVGLAQAAVAAGVTGVIATPHIRDDYPFPLGAIAERADELRAALRERDIPLEVWTGGEVSLAKALDLSDDELREVALGDGSYLLVESPYGPATDLLERTLFHLQTRGLTPVLAHPERSPSFQADLGRLATCVERGILTSITAASMAGQFGRTVQRAASEMLTRGLVHDIASDSHDPRRRGPGLGRAFESLAGLRGLEESREWYTRSAPAAIVAGEPLPPAPERPRQRRGLPRPFGRRGG